MNVVMVSFVPLSHEVKASARVNAGQIRLVNRTIWNMARIMNMNDGGSQTVHVPCGTMIFLAYNAYRATIAPA